MDDKNTVKADLSPAEKAKSDALRLLSIRPRSVEELRVRLRLKKYPTVLVDEVLESLKKIGLLDDEKFARLLANSLVDARPTGRRQLAFDLKKKGLSEALVAKTIEALPEYDEKKAARDLAYRRFQRMTGIPAEKKKNRIFGFLKRRGFSSEVIFSVLSELWKEENFFES